VSRFLSHLILGGARSGKSRHALDLARAVPGPVAFVATAEERDDDMAARIARHRAERPPHWLTVEAPLDLVGGCRKAAARADLVLVDCLTLWLSNGSCDVEATIQAAGEQTAEVIFVTNEVGGGIVPDNAMAREFRDRAGVMNQRFAEAADEVYWMVFGQPLRVK